MVSVKTAWRLGAEAARRGRPLEANPFRPGTSQHTGWTEGWRLEDALPKQDRPQGKPQPRVPQPRGKP
jgi:hypothetical protein